MVSWGMPFHASGRKPTVVAKRPVSSIKQRICLIALGSLCLAVGFSKVRFSRGAVLIFDWNGFPYLGEVIALGLILIALAAIPFSWIENLARRLDSRDRTRL